jgi:hypothetical protein
VDAVVVAGATVAPPSGVTAVLEIWKPSPLPSVQLMPVVDEAHVNGPRVIDMPYPRVGVFSPALERHWSPVHSVSEPAVFSVTDLGGEMVRHSAEVMALGPRLSSISQLMFFEGERNSVPVDVCGTRVPVVWEVDVVLGDEPDVVEVGAADVVVVLGEDDGEGLLEQADSATASAGRISTPSHHFRIAMGMSQAYDGVVGRAWLSPGPQGHPRSGGAGGLPGG